MPGPPETGPERNTKMRDVAIAGAGMTRFGKYKDRGLKDLSREAVEAALDAAGMDKADLQIAVEIGRAACRERV